MNTAKIHQTLALPYPHTLPEEVRKAGSNPSGGRIVFSPDGKRLATVVQYLINIVSTPITTVWRTSDYTRMLTVAADLVDFSPDGKIFSSISCSYIMEACFPRRIELRDMKSGEVVRTLAGSELSPDWQLAAGWVERWIKLWQVSDGSEVGTLATRENSRHKVRFSPNGQLLVATGDDGLYLWRVR